MKNLFILSLLCVCQVTLGSFNGSIVSQNQELNRPQAQSVHSNQKEVTVEVEVWRDFIAKAHNNQDDMVTKFRYILIYPNSDIASLPIAAPPKLLERSQTAINR